jgi:hypothetical protein
MAMSVDELKARRAANQQMHPANGKTKEPETAFDGSAMPTQDLPEVKFTNLEKMFADAIKPMRRQQAPAMGVIYGPWGTRKTTVAMKMALGIVPTGKTILYIDSANGWTTLMNYPEIMAAADRNEIMRMQFASIEQLQTFFRDVIMIDKPPFNQIGAVIFDEYTSMHDFDLNWIVKTRSKQAKDEGGFKDSFTPALPDYNAARIRSNDLLYFAMKNKIHLFFIGHSKETKKLEQLPDMPEKAAKSLVKELHFVYYTFMDKQTGEWKMQTVNGNRIAAKNRINGIQAYTTPEEFIECYKRWGVDESIKEVEVEKIPEEEIPEPDDLTKLLE